MTNALQYNKGGKYNKKQLYMFRESWKLSRRRYIGGENIY